MVSGTVAAEGDDLTGSGEPSYIPLFDRINNFWPSLTRCGHIERIPEMAARASTGPKAPPKLDGGDPSTREHIVQTALKCFSRNGFEGASTRTIATTAGVNQGLIPYYFGTKQALWREAVDQAFAELHSAIGMMEGAVTANPTKEAIAGVIRRYVSFVAANPEFVLMMNEEGKRDGARMQWIVDRHVRPVFESLSELFGRVGATIDLPKTLDPIHLTYIFAGAVATIFHQAPECRRVSGYDPMEESAIEAHADTLIHLMFGDVTLGRAD